MKTQTSFVDDCTVPEDAAKAEANHKKTLPDVAHDLLAGITDSVRWCNCYYGADHVFMHNREENGMIKPYGDWDGRCRGWYQPGIVS